MSEPSSIRSYDQKLLNRLHSVKLRPITGEIVASEPGSFNGRPSRRLPKLIMDEQKYVPEMVATIKSNAPIIGLRRASSMKGPQMTPESSISEVQSWLTAKGFSDYTKKILSKCHGLHLFQLTKQILFKHCGDEGNRLHSILLAQKQRCNYDSRRGDQLKALLEMRKEHVDENNEGELEPSLDPPNTVDENGNHIIGRFTPITSPYQKAAAEIYITPNDITPPNTEDKTEFLREVAHTVRAYH